MRFIGNEAKLQKVAEEERDLLNKSEILQPLRPQACWAGKLIVHENVAVTSLMGTFPADTRYNRHIRSVVLDFDVPTYSELGAHYTEGDKAAYDMLQRAYIGAGLARLLFVTQGAEAPKRKLKSFAQTMADQDKLLGKLYESIDINPGEGVLRKLINDADATAHINGLRLSLGVWKEARGSDDYAQSLEPVFRKSLAERLANKPQYVEFAGIFKVTEEGAEDTFAEHLADIQIAGSSPMNKNEIEQAVKLLT